MTEIVEKRSYGRDKGNDPECPYVRDKTSFTSSQPEPKLSGLMEWTTPNLVEIEYTDERRRRYWCEVIEEAT
jgi:hypothetical protein